VGAIPIPASKSSAALLYNPDHDHIRCRFKPAVKSGDPVPVEIHIEVNFEVK